MNASYKEMYIPLQSKLKSYIKYELDLIALSDLFIEKDFYKFSLINNDQFYIEVLPLGDEYRENGCYLTSNGITCQYMTLQHLLLDMINTFFNIENEN